MATVKIGDKKRKSIIGRIKIGESTDILNTPTYERKADVTVTWNKK
jgi:hypothetical protein